MNFEFPDLDKVKHLIFLQDKTPFEKYHEIVDNILNKQFLELQNEKKMNYKIYIFYMYFINNEFNRIN
jgi:hypothetical protein